MPHFIASHDLVEGSESISLLHYLDQLEAANPIVQGWIPPVFAEIGSGSVDLQAK